MVILGLKVVYLPKWEFYHVDVNKVSTNTNEDVSFFVGGTRTGCKWMNISVRYWISETVEFLFRRTEGTSKACWLRFL